MLTCSAAGAQPASTAAVRAFLLPTGFPISSAAAPGVSPSSCPDPMAIMKVFYDANDASRFDVSLGLFAENATLSSWAEGINGHHMRERHLTGKTQIRSALGDQGLRRTSDRPDGPIYQVTRAKVSGDHVSFMLEPDRQRPNGKAYNPFRVEAVFEGCKIKSLTVIDSVTWL